ncbi:CATRA system-associated protein [Streptomyces sp. NPDC059688]|uniref:CATRA-Associated Small Protein domain-containing protein n=2 Tax=Streptomyces TaxID=1883 RepID=A0ABY6EHN1_9ACTN|nr:MULTISPECIES: CATRA system-associated protein [unclassified Streptomyces]OKJ80916.1 hypothetical protein AMK32_24680 [Streptomyces sp. CB01883]UXY33533.1 hypothetical protein N8I86_01520 [Streptomyces sp. HUAS 14-6]
MSTSDGTAAIDRETAGAARLALRLMLEEWRLPPQGWEETAELLAELSTAVAAGDTAAVDALTGELEELSGSRVTRIEGAQDGPPDGDGKVPLPEPYRERVVALVHALDPDPTPGGARPAAAERT